MLFLNILSVSYPFPLLPPFYPIFPHLNHPQSVPFSFFISPVFYYLPFLKIVQKLTLSVTWLGNIHFTLLALCLVCGSHHCALNPCYLMYKSQ